MAPATHDIASAAPTPAGGRVQLALNVDDLDASVAFYSALFGTDPAKRRPGYANFAIARPPLKLVLLENPGKGGTLNHLGVEFASSDAVRSESVRLAAQHLLTDEELGTTCCFATQDKVWVAAPDGERWEVYTVLTDSETFGASPSTAAAGTAGTCGPGVCSSATGGPLPSGGPVPPLDDRPDEDHTAAMTTPHRFAVPLSDLELGARVALSQQVQEQPEPRLHQSWNAALPMPEGTVGEGAPGCDGE